MLALSVAYNVPAKYMRRVPGNRAVGATISVVGRNLKTWTRYSGYDPDAADSGQNFINRLDSYAYPQYRTFSAVLTLKF